jgi:hypothetical protein
LSLRLKSATLLMSVAYIRLFPCHIRGSELGGVDTLAKRLAARINEGARLRSLNQVPELSLQ